MHLGAVCVCVCVCVCEPAQGPERGGLRGRILWAATPCPCPRAAGGPGGAGRGGGGGGAEWAGSPASRPLPPQARRA